MSTLALLVSDDNSGDLTIGTLAGQAFPFYTPTSPGVAGALAALSADGSFWYAMDYHNLCLYKVDTTTLEVTVSASSLLDADCWGIAVKPDGSEVWVSSEESGGKVQVLSTSTMAVTHTITGFAGSNASEQVGFTTDGSKAYITDYSSLDVYVIDTSTYALSSTISLPSGSTSEGLCFTPDGTKCYITDGSSGNIYVVNCTTDAYVSTITTSGSNMFDGAVSPNGSKAVFSANGNSKAVIITCSTDTVAATLALSGAPWQPVITSDSSTCYLGEPYGGGSGTLLAEINLTSDTLTSETSTNYSPWGMALFEWTGIMPLQATTAWATNWLLFNGLYGATGWATDWSATLPVYMQGESDWNLAFYGPLTLGLGSTRSWLIVADVGNQGVQVFDQRSAQWVTHLSSPSTYYGYIFGMTLDVSTGTLYYAFGPYGVGKAPIDTWVESGRVMAPSPQQWGYPTLPLSSDGSIVIAFGQDSTPSNFLNIIDTASMTITATVSLVNNTTAGCFSADNSKIYVVDDLNNLVVVDVSTATITNTIALSGFSPHAVAVSNDGTTLWISSFAQVLIYDTSSLTLAATLSIPSRYLNNLAMTEDGLYSVSFDLDVPNVSVFSVPGQDLLATGSVGPGYPPIIIGQSTVPSAVFPLAYSIYVDTTPGPNGVIYFYPTSAQGFVFLGGPTGFDASGGIVESAQTPATGHIYGAMQWVTDFSGSPTVLIDLSGTTTWVTDFSGYFGAIGISGATHWVTAFSASLLIPSDLSGSTTWVTAFSGDLVPHLTPFDDGGAFVRLSWAAAAITLGLPVAATYLSWADANQSLATAAAWTTITLSEAEITDT